MATFTIDKPRFFSGQNPIQVANVTIEFDSTDTYTTGGIDITKEDLGIEPIASQVHAQGLYIRNGNVVANPVFYDAENEKLFIYNGDGDEVPNGDSLNGYRVELMVIYW